MIVEYHRPETLQAALDLLSRADMRTLPMGGGTRLSHYRGDPIAVVDLQSLGLGKIEKSDNNLLIGAMVRLQELIENKNTPQGLRDLLRYETNYNLRQMATAAGTIASGDGKSPFLCAMLALDARTLIQPGEKRMSVRDWLEEDPKSKLGCIITSISISCDVLLTYELVGRTPQDIPILSVTMAKWTGGRRRIVIGGGVMPQIVEWDGGEFGDVMEAIENACSHIDSPLSLQYITNITKILANRLSES